MLKGRAFRFGDNVDINISYIIPTVMCLAIIGSYAVNSSFVDIFVMAGTGIMSFLLVKFGFGLGPVVL
ncbi:MAG: tripartite tricarboxylate transporter permease, partial [Nitrospinota bacterium]